MKGSISGKRSNEKRKERKKKKAVRSSPWRWIHLHRSVKFLVFWAQSTTRDYLKAEGDFHKEIIHRWKDQQGRPEEQWESGELSGKMGRKSGSQKLVSKEGRSSVRGSITNTELWRFCCCCCCCCPLFFVVVFREVESFANTELLRVGGRWGIYLYRPIKKKQSQMGWWMVRDSFTLV